MALAVAVIIAPVTGDEQDVHDQLGDLGCVFPPDQDVLIELGDFDLIGHQVMLFTPGCKLSTAVLSQSADVAGLVSHIFPNAL